MIHYHGTPITPKHELDKMAGRSFCVSYARRDNAKWCLQNGQSIMWDNGAFSFYTRKTTVDWDGFYSWVEPLLAGAHWAVVPDVIEGDIEQNLELIRQWPHRKDLACVVWHMDEPLGHLLKLRDMGFGKIAFGSSGKYWKVGNSDWCRRADEAFNTLTMTGPLPWVHMLRGLRLAGERWPFASLDSTNVGRNFKTRNECPDSMARRIDAIQSPIHWTLKGTK